MNDQSHQPTTWAPRMAFIRPFAQCEKNSMHSDAVKGCMGEATLPPAGRFRGIIPASLDLNEGAFIGCSHRGSFVVSLF